KALPLPAPAHNSRRQAVLRHLSYFLSSPPCPAEKPAKPACLSHTVCVRPALFHNNKDHGEESLHSASPYPGKSADCESCLPSSPFGAQSLPFPSPRSR